MPGEIKRGERRRCAACQGSVSFEMTVADSPGRPSARLAMPARARTATTGGAGTAAAAT